MSGEEKNDDVSETNTSNGKVSASLFHEYNIPTDPHMLRREKRNIYKNLLLICLSFILNFTAFAGISNLQSSLNEEENLGVVSLSVIYAALITSALFSPTFIITHLGCKWGMFWSIVGYTTYYLANFYPHWGTLIPSSIILGLSGAPLWAAKCAYLTTAATRYARLIDESPDTVVNRFFGIFFMMFQINQIIGNLISSVILSSGDSLSLVFPSNISTEREMEITNYCGANDCPGNDDASGGSNDPPERTIYILMGTYTACGLLAAVNMAVLVDPITIRLTDARSTKDLLIATFTQLRDCRQILLITITIFSGVQQAFLAGDFTNSFVTCPIAVNWVGFVLICFGVCDAACSFLFGRLAKHTGRMPLVIMAATIHLSLIITLLLWVPLPSSPAPFFVIPALWGVADAVWQTQLNALYGVMFFNCQEAAFSNYRLWESLGFGISFAYQGFLCVDVKLYILLALLIVGMVSYMLVPRCSKNATNHKPTLVSDEDYGTKI